MTFKDILTTYRSEHKLTIPTMAKKIGVPQRPLENWLAGSRVPDELKQRMVKSILGVK